MTLTSKSVYGPTCHSYGIRGYGTPGYGVAFVGLAPSKDEIRTGLPYQGMTGKIIDALLSSTGWHRSKIYCTNLCCWRPRLPNGGDRDPDNMELLECVDRLEEELTTIAPKLVVALGAQAAEVLTGHKLGDVRGDVVWKDDHYVLPVNQPTAIFHGSFELGNLLVRDFAKIGQVVGWPSGGLQPPQVHIIQTTEEAQKVLDNLPKNVIVSLDVETSRKDDEGIDIYVDRLTCLSLGYQGNVWFMLPDIITKDLKWPMDVMWTFQNGQYDVQALAHHCGVWLPICRDSMLESYALYEIPGNHALKKNSREFLGAPRYEEPIRIARKRKETVQLEQNIAYNTMDTHVTGELENKFYSRIVAEERPKVYRSDQQAYTLQELYEKILIPATNIYARMQYRGVAINTENVDRLLDKWLPRRMRMRSELAKMARDVGFQGDMNPKSPKQVSHVMFDLFKMEGGPSTAKPVLDTLKGHPFVDLLREARHLEHTLDAYVFGVQDDIKGDGRIHPNALLHGTRTGRPAYNSPPIQQILHEEDEEVGDYGEVRTIFGTTNDDYVLLEADFSQAEVWTTQSLSGDKNMLIDLQSGDYHSRVTESVFNIQKSQVSDGLWANRRRKAKIVSFRVFYGSEAEGLARSMDASLVEAKGFLSNFNSRYYGFLEWRAWIMRQLQEEGQVAGLGGHIRRFPLVLGDNVAEAYRQAVNQPIQETASVCPIIALIEMYPYVTALDCWPLFTVHDSIVFEANVKTLPQAASIIQDYMTRPKFQNFPSIPVDIKYGRTWGEAYNKIARD